MNIIRKKIIYVADPLFKKSNFFNYKKNNKKYRIIFNKTKKTLKTSDLKKIFQYYKNIVGVIAGLEKYDLYSLDNQKNLKAISRVGVGIDSLDLNYLKQRNIKIIKLTNELTYCVSELFLTLILSSLRKIIPNYKLLKKKVWSPIIGNNLKNKKIGIIGFGKIGKNLYKLLKIFDCEIFIFEKKKINNSNMIKKNLEFIFKHSDVVCVSLNLNITSQNIINSKILKNANKEIILINASRGKILNENDLYKFLKKNNKASAYLDCFVKEPYKGKLLNLTNVFPIPHIASFTAETRKDMEFSASKNLIKFLK